MEMESEMANQSGSTTDADADRRQELSALVDGELAADGVQRICAAWRDKSSARETWHAYSLIGDVMRSEDLASSAAHDARFLRDFQARMLTEPIVLAPQAARVGVDGTRELPPPVGARRSTGRFWSSPAAVAAGFVVVVGAMVATQVPPPLASDPTPMAMLPVSMSVTPAVAPAQVAVIAAQAEASAPGTELVFDGQIIRDPRLDRYLLAHKQFSGSSVLGAPSGFLRNAAAEVPAR